MNLDFAANWTQILSFIVPPLIAFVMWVAKKWVQDAVREMGHKVDEATRPIQPYANGGKSLPDLVNLTQQVLDGQGLLHEKVNTVITDLAHLRGRFDQHIEEGSHD